MLSKSKRNEQGDKVEWRAESERVEVGAEKVGTAMGAKDGQDIGELR